MWFLELGHQRVSLGKIWAICQMGRWPVFLDPNSEPFLNSFVSLVLLVMYSIYKVQFPRNIPLS